VLHVLDISYRNCAGSQNHGTRLAYSPFVRYGPVRCVQ
jgi:hypothetical protein